MNLQQLIERYIAYRQALGEYFKGNAYILRAFSRAIGSASDVADVHPGQIDTFLAGTGAITRTWHVKYNALLGFYRYAISRGHAASSPLPAVLPKPPSPFVPYIYARDQVCRLLHVARSYQHPLSSMEPITMHTLVLLLYGTGLRVREAITLDLADVDLRAAVLTIRRTKFYKTRLVPFGGQLGRALAHYLTRRPQGAASAKESVPVFTTRHGSRISYPMVQRCFRQLRKQAGIRRSDPSRYQPRLHDLRHTFAVHRLTSWYQQGADVLKLLPMLSVYLGHAHIAATQVYLSMTPDLLAEAGARFERYAEEGGNHD